MKQKEIFIDPSLGFETTKMKEMYFLVKTVSQIEGFVHSEEEFLKRYKNTYSFNDLRTVTYFAIYHIKRCPNCKSTYNIIVAIDQKFTTILGRARKFVSAVKYSSLVLKICSDPISKYFNVNRYIETARNF